MPKYAEEILAAVTELQQHPTAEQHHRQELEQEKENLMEEKYYER